MVERTIPWWRKALNYALSGIRSLLRPGRSKADEARDLAECASAVPATEPDDSPDDSPRTQESKAEADVPVQPTQKTIAEARAILETVVAVEDETVAAPEVLSITAAEMAPGAISALEMIELAVEKTKPEAIVVEAEIVSSVATEEAPSVETIEPTVEDVPAAMMASDAEREIAPVIEEQPEAHAPSGNEVKSTREALEVLVPAVAETVAEASPAAAAAIPAESSNPEAEARPIGEPKAATAKSDAELKTAARVAAAIKAREESADASPFSIFVGQVYEGPLDLLLDLIRKQDIDIYDIPIAKITAQFLAYVNQLKASDMDVAGEFIYTASLLIHIKSKMLLPRTTVGPEEAAEDPRRELVERLLEHERFKNAAQMLQQKQMLESATWTNPGVREFREDAGAGSDIAPEIAADTTDLVRIFREILERARNRPIINVEEDSVTVGQMIQFLARRLTMEDKPVALRKLLSHTRSERALIAMFLALLELVRMQAILLRQDRHFSEIFVKKHSGFETAMDQGLASARDDWR